jgi:organic radical activating enzyme
VDLIYVSEVFRSIQGEGPFAGWPATFVRLSFCNLHCTWCDTWYTWDKTRIDVVADARKMTAAELAQAIDRTDLLVITGGEPLLQWKRLQPALARSRWVRCQVETNGTLYPPRFTWATWVVSPKLANNGADPLDRRIKPDVLKEYAWCDSYFKFVISNEEDVAEVEALVSTTLRGVSRDRIYLMPEGRTPKQLEARAPWVAEQARLRGWRYSDRLHIRLWGDRRGV